MGYPPTTNDNALFRCTYGSPPPTSDNTLLRCLYVDMCIFGTLNLHSKHKCNRGCGGYLHGDFFGDQDKNKIYLKNIVLMIHMCNKCASNMGKTELTYKALIDT